MSAQLTSDDSPPVTAHLPAPSQRVAAWMPAGMLDWPGRVAATVFVSGCEFRCAFCHNPSLLEPRTAWAGWVEFTEYVERRRGWIDGVVVTGGEPTSDPAIVDLLAAVRAEGVPVKLDTNGSRPDVLHGLLEEGLVDFVAMDIKTMPHRYDALTGSARSAERVTCSARMLIESDVAHEFRTTCFPPIVRLDELPMLAESLHGGQRYVLQQFRGTQTLDPSATQQAAYHASELAEAAHECTRWIPTTTRGV